MNASGANILPSCASSAKTGRKLSVIMSKLKNSAGPTSPAASATRRQRFASVSPALVDRPLGLALSPANSNFLCMFSIMTVAPSIMAPIAIAIPPSDIMLALIPCRFMTVNAASTPTGKLMIATSDERK